MQVKNSRLYQHTGQALVRAAREPIHAVPGEWPDLAEGGSQHWRHWLGEVWSWPATAEAITLASPSLARQVTDICAGTPTKQKHLRRAVTAVAQYVLRETSRPTPFGLFAGVASAEFGPGAKARWGQDHHAVARADTQWLAEVITHLEACPALVDRLAVTVTNLRQRRGDVLVLPSSATRVELRHTPAVQAVERVAATPIRFDALVETLSAEFTAASSTTVRGMLAELLAQGVLVTCLRPPTTVTDPLTHVLEQLDAIQAEQVVEVAHTVRELRAIHADLQAHNQAAPQAREQERAVAIQRMRGLSQAAKSPVAVDLHLDCDVELPEHLAHEMEAAASALTRLSAQPAGSAVWRDYYAAFLHRYGTGVVVPVADLVDPQMGLGYPATYPGSLFTPPQESAPPGRDARLLALAYHAAHHRREEIVLDEDTIATIVDEDDAVRVPPHVELSARIHAASAEAIDRGEYTLTVAPGRAAGTMTGRFTQAGTPMAQVFADLPTSTPGALVAQLSFPPAYPHAENVGRTPRFVDHLISLGEHRDPDEEGMLPVEDLAVIADTHRLHLISLSRGRPVEPQVFTALALEKQAPPLARFLAHLSRARSAAYTELDWGTAATLPYLPRVRYGRSVLAPARWRIEAADLPPRSAAFATWDGALTQWCAEWGVPDTVEVRDHDRTLRLDMFRPAHAVLLREHLERAGEAILTETTDAAGLGWLEGHAHQVVVPLVATQPAAPSPVISGTPHARPDQGHLPAAPQTRWLFAWIYVHPERQSAVLARHLPRLLADLGGQVQWWFLRYRSEHDGDHLRLRIRVTGPEEYTHVARAVGAWVSDLRHARLCSRLVLDTYAPEVGRYGDGATLATAEATFAADSEVVLTQLQQVPDTAAHPTALAAVNLVHIACGFTGSTTAGMHWLIERSLAPAVSVPREVTDQAVVLATRPDVLHALPGWSALAPHWEARRTALAAYRAQLAQADADSVLESLLHMHHIRAVGIDRDGEHACRRLARAAALAWRATTEHQ